MSIHFAVWSVGSKSGSHLTRKGQLTSGRPWELGQEGQHLDLGDPKPCQSLRELNKGLVSSGSRVLQ